MGLFDDVEKAKKRTRGPEVADPQPAPTEEEKKAKKVGALAGKKAFYLLELAYMHPIFPETGGVLFKNVFKVAEILKADAGVDANEKDSKVGICLFPKSRSFLGDVKELFEALVPGEAVDAAGVASCYGVETEKRTQAQYPVARYEPASTNAEREGKIQKRFVGEDGKPLPISAHPLAGRKVIAEVYLKENGFQNFAFYPENAPPKELTKPTLPAA